MAAASACVGSGCAPHGFVHWKLSLQYGCAGTFGEWSLAGGGAVIGNTVPTREPHSCSRTLVNSLKRIPAFDSLSYYAASFSHFLSIKL